MTTIAVREMEQAVEEAEAVVAEAAIEHQFFAVVCPALDEIDTQGSGSFARHRAELQGAQRGAEQSPVSPPLREEHDA